MNNLEKRIKENDIEYITDYLNNNEIPKNLSNRIFQSAAYYKSNDILKILLEDSRFCLNNHGIKGVTENIFKGIENSTPFSLALRTDNFEGLSLIVRHEKFSFKNIKKSMIGEFINIHDEDFKDTIIYAVKNKLEKGSLDLIDFFSIDKKIIEMIVLGDLLDLEEEINQYSSSIPIPIQAVIAFEQDKKVVYHLVNKLINNFDIDTLVLKMKTFKKNGLYNIVEIANELSNIPKIKESLVRNGF